MTVSDLEGICAVEDRYAFAADEFVGAGNGWLGDRLWDSTFVTAGPRPTAEGSHIVVLGRIGISLTRARW